MLSVGDVFGKAFQDYARHWVPLVLTVLVVAVIWIVLRVVEQVAIFALAAAIGAAGLPPALALVVSFGVQLVNLVVQAFFLLGWAAISLKAARGRDDPQLDDLFSQSGRLVQAVIAQILVAIATMIAAIPGVGVGVGVAIATDRPELGFLAGIPVLLLPVTLIWLLTVFTNFFIVDRQLDAISALGASIDAAKGNLLGLVVFGLASFGLMLAGTLACLLPAAFVAWPVIMIALAHAFDALAPAAEADVDYGYEGYGAA